MASVSFEDWLEMSDDERVVVATAWKTAKGEGKDIANQAAELLKRECVYNLLQIDTHVNNGEWRIHAYMDTYDYEKLKDRQTEKFLGFGITFNNIEDYKK